MLIEAPWNYGSDNDWGIPLLDAYQCARVLPLPFYPWGSKGSAKYRSSVHFYVDDRKFANLWSSPQKLVEREVFCAVEPNFSINAQTSRAIAMYQIFRKRWIARYWQQCGVKVLVDLNVNPEFEDLNMLGVPKGWYAYATRGHADDLDSLIAQYSLAQRWSGEPNPLFVVYSGGQKVLELARKYGWQYYPMWRGECSAVEHIHDKLLEN